MLAAGIFVVGLCDALSFGLIHVASAQAMATREPTGPSRVYLDDIVPATGDGSSLRLYLRVETSSGESLTGLDAEQVSIRDNGIAVEPDQIEITTINEARRGTAVVLVLDSSRSMRGRPFDRAKHAALEFTTRMGEDDQIAVVTFHDEVAVVGDFGTPREVLRERIAALSVQKKTLAKRVWDGAAKGLELIGNSRHALPRRVFMIVFSDGRDSGSEASPDALLARALGGPSIPRTPIFSVGYMGFGSAGLAGLRELSEGTGAEMYQLGSTKDIDQFFSEISSRMNHSYVASYPAEFDGKRHRVEVQIGAASDAREADYPNSGGSGVYLISGLVAIVAMLGAAAAMMRGNSPTGELVIASGLHADQTFALSSRTVRIGALDSNDLVLNFTSVSRHHATLKFGLRSLQLLDLKSKNGTFINDRRIHTQGSIRPGDRIRLGEVELIYRT
jgi:Mg-chelatase subunit ChlD